ncbi:MAG: PAS domain S-box protein [Chloroflexi bacterium]|uniref:PAS domain S-box protein n=1 Tax=Candidatus Flexifilum breve TaxID=3140694 RepID=UPI0031366DA7|nr:PAS domain S-box protein [Chloroflexota bacterium]
MKQPDTRAITPYVVLSIGTPFTQPDLLLERLRELVDRPVKHEPFLTLASLEAALTRTPDAVIVCDFDNPQIDPETIVRRVQHLLRSAPVIVAAHTAHVNVAVDMMRLGASGFVAKADTDRLLQLIQQGFSQRAGVTAEPTTGEAPVEAVRALRDQIHAILDTTQDALMSISLPDRQLIYVSASYEKIYGYPVALALEDPDFYKHVVLPDDLELATAAMETCLREGFVEVDHRIVLPDGQVRWLHRRAWITYDEQGRPAQVNDSARDITARKTMEAALQQSEGRLRSLFVNLQDVVWSADIPSYEIEYLNPAARTVFGRPESDFYEDCELWRKIIHPDDAHRVEELGNSLLHGGRRDATYRILRPDGEVRWLHDRAWIVRDAEGQPVRMEGIASDITTRKLAEEALIASEAKQAALFAAIPDSIFYLRSDGTVLEYHGASDKILLPPEQIIGNNLYDFFKFALVPQMILQQAIAAVQTVIATRELAVFEYTMPDLRDYEARMIPVGDTNALMCIVREITERKRAERQLQQSEQRLRLFIEHAPAAIAIFDTQMLYLAASRRWSQDYRLPDESIIGRSHYDVFPEIPERWKVIHQRCLNGAVEKCEADPFPRADGTLDWVRWEAHPWRDIDGAIGGILLFSEVITERVQAEAALRQSESYLRSLVDSQTAFNMRTDLLGRITYCNQRYIDQFGWVAPDMIGRLSMEMVLPADHDKVIAAVSGCLTSVGTPYQVEIRKYAKGGGHIWTLWEFIAVQNADGSVGEVNCVGFDISKQKQAELALQEANERLEQRVIERTAELERAKDRIEAIFQHSGDGILLLDLAAGIQQANYAFDEMLALASGSTHGAQLATYLHPDDAVRIDAVIAEVAATHQMQQIEARARRAEATFIDVEINIAPVNRSEQAVTNLVCIIRDITERKHAQDALRASEERLRILFDTSPDAICLINLKGVFVDVNPAGLMLVGLSREELVGKSLSELGLFTNPVYQRQTVDGLGLTRQGSGRTSEYEVRTSTGEIIVIEAVTHPIKLEDELLQLAVIRNITERRRAEAALRESEERYRRLISTMSEGIVLQTRDGSIQTFNVAAERILGLSGDQLMGRTSVDPRWHAVHEDGSPFPGNTHPAMVALATGQPQSNIMMGVHKPDDENITWILVNSQPLFEPHQAQPYAVVTTFTDITANKLADAALRESEERYRLLAENVNDVIIRLAPDATLTFATASITRLLGYPLEELIGQGGFSIVHPDDLVMSQTTVANALVAHLPYFTLVERIRHKDGHYIWVEGGNSNVYDPATGELVEMVGVLRDMTARRQAEEALRESEERYRLLAENVNDVLFRVDAKGAITFITASAHNVLGYAPDELLDVPVSTLAHPDDMATAIEVVQNTFIAQGTHLTLNARVLHKTGVYVWVEIAATLVHDPRTAQAVELIGVLRDVTERKLAEDALRASEEKFRTFLEAAPIATVIANMQGRVVVVNQAAAELFGYERSELIGRSIGVLVSEEYRKEQFNRVNSGSTQSNQRTFFFESMGLRRDGSRFPCDTQLSFIETSEGAMVMSHVIDTTQRKQAEAALKQSLAQERELGELKSRFVSMASHEFRTPLAAILAATETLSLYRDRMDKAQIEGRLERIRQQVTYMRDTMEDVLNLARMQAGRVKFEPRSGDVAALAREIVNEFDSQIEFQGRLVFTCATAPLHAEFDERLLRQIFSNLIHNALKYSIHNQSVSVHLLDSEAAFRLRIEDHGIGIPDDDLKHLFEPFHRAKNVGTISGTGLGLSITRQSVELHGGTITVESREGVGTTFEVIIPKVAQPRVDVS